MRSSSKTSSFNLPFSSSSCGSDSGAGVNAQLLTLIKSESFLFLDGVAGGTTGSVLAGRFSLKRLIPSVIVDSSIGFPK